MQFINDISGSIKFDNSLSSLQVEDANDVFTSLGEIMEGNLPPPLEGYSTELSDVISRCLSLSGDERPSLLELVELSVNKCDANPADNLVAVLQE